MPCDSSYMEPNGKEKELQRTAYLLTFVYSQLEQEIPVYMVDTAKNQYARADFVADLCAKIQSLGEEDFERIVYNGRSKISRNLADWWERHEEADRAREAKEAAEAKKERQIEQALAKLTPKDREVLGL